MRDIFVDTLLELARADRRIMLITGDLGFGVLDKFCRELPSQYINAGVAEQNMTGLAAGMALEGKVVFTYSIANFPTFRCLEQIRNDVIYHNANVKIVAIGGGLSYGALGMSHHATEDVGIMRVLPEIRVYAPCDGTEARALTAQMVTEPGPCYLRLDKSQISQAACEDYVPGTLRCLRRGTDVAILGYGGILDEALKSAEQLSKDGIECAVYSAHTLKPFDAATLLRLAREMPALVTIEEHVRTGGLGSLVADVLLDAGVMPQRLRRIALPDAHSSIVGSQEYLRTRLQVDSTTVVRAIRELIAT